MSNPLFVAASLILILIATASVGAVVHFAKAEDAMNAKTQTAARPHPYVGMWMTEDGRIRHELLANNRYDEARGSRESAYRGRYEVTGSHIDYWDDTGFTADGDFVSLDVLHHGGMVFYRRK